MFPGEQHIRLAACLLGNMASFVFDFCARQKVGGTNLKYFIMKQLPALAPARYQQPALWDNSVSLRDWITERVLELSYTAQDLAGFAADCGYEGPPFRWDPERRAVLRAELDAAFFYLYEVSLDDTVYILNTFNVLRDKELRERKEYRTKRLVLERYDALLTAISTGRRYVSPLDSDIEGTALEQQVPGVVRTLRDGEWATPEGLSEGDLTLFALLEVLRCAGGPLEAARVRIASIFVRKPAMVLPFIDAATRLEWTRLVGRDATPLPSNVLDLSQFKKNAVDHPWNEAVTLLTGSQVLKRDSATNLWSATARLPASTQTWMKDRVEMIMPLVRALDLPAVQKKVASFLKEVKRGATASAVS
jgi:hypothetical protein